MFKNFLRITWRHITRNGVYVLVNVLGLGIGLACCVISFLNFSFDRSYDRFHENADQIYRLTAYKESNGRLYGMVPMPIAGEARKDIAGLEATINLHSRGMVVKHAEEVFNQTVHFADGPFLETFHFPMFSGDATAIKDPGSILITEEMAEKYFGEEEPLGKELVLYAGEEAQRVVVVKGVLEDLPLNSSIRFTMLLHLDNLIINGEQVLPNNWELFTHTAFLKLENGVDVASINEALQRYVPVWNKAREDWTISSFVLEPFTETAHRGREVEANYLMPSFPPAAVWGPNLLGLLILLTACLNFTNTTISLSDRRLKEMGVRKVMGGTQGQLIAQLLGETLIICSLALLAALVFVDWLLPYYNAMWPYLHLETDYLSNPPLILFLGGLLLVTLFLAGSYPAFYLSSFQPSHIFRSKISFGGSHLFSRLLLGGQVLISLVAVIGGLAFAKNAKFQEETDMGYDRKGLIVTPIDGAQDFQTLRNALISNPAIQQLAASDGHVGYRMYGEDFASQGLPYEALRLNVGDNYLELMGIALKMGRDFRPGPESDMEAVIVNEKLIQHFGWEDPLGRQLTIDSVTYTLTGVVGDFINANFFSPQSPMLIIKSRPEDYRFLIARCDPGNEAAVKDQIGSTWQGLFPYRPFDATFQEEVISEGMMVSSNIKVTFLFLAFITIILSSIGLFALVSLNILKRLKEIAIRRIIGASMRDIVILVNRNYVWIFLGGTLLGCVGGAILAQKLLSSIFAIYVELDMVLFLFSALGVLLIAAITVGWRLSGVLRVNPADILRSE